ncbi:HdeD family acid-resistance protein [Bosea sp. 117]|uniref:HdeD family acid-resistance protein n=1 Tax=Bosea sp. 117 TaxID=1125973 RepID=UPI00056F6960|nr:HdeD family acid-resistance protein [Bosea sp. 117]
MSLPTDSLSPTPAGSLAGQLSTLRAKWGWFVALGALMIIAGLIALANLMLGTLVSVLYIGVMMAVAGVGQIFHAFGVKGWGAFFFWLLAGVLYLVAGAMVFNNPLLAAGVFTLVLGVSLVVAGIFRGIAAFQLRPHEGWGWLAFSAAITLLLGIEIMIRWPVNSVWILGLFLGIDLLFNGVAVLLLGLRLKK